jgi:hypothetical protein
MQGTEDDQSNDESTCPATTYRRLHKGPVQQAGTAERGEGEAAPAGGRTPDDCTRCHRAREPEANGDADALASLVTQIVLPTADGTREGGPRALPRHRRRVRVRRSRLPEGK